MAIHERRHPQHWYNMPRGEYAFYSDRVEAAEHADDKLASDWGRPALLSAASYTLQRDTTIDLYINQDQVLSLLTTGEVTSLSTSCYHDQGFGHVVVSGIFNIFTSFVKKGAGSIKDGILS
ncbi:hypothetical protein AYO22_11743 [Fonsecaea multimorphosa]|nr:hypothetical protein AYO22_11743 [Fonsecaea multimorphosa]